jgi:hypothetical protein
MPVGLHVLEQFGRSTKELSNVSRGVVALFDGQETMGDRRFMGKGKNLSPPYEIGQF